jgi:hypothetical protein
MQRRFIHKLGQSQISISHVVSIFGDSAVVGVRKRPPKVTKKLPDNESAASNHGDTQMLDVINVDVSLKRNFPPFYIYFMWLNSLKMSIQCKQYVSM